MSDILRNPLIRRASETPGQVMTNSARAKEVELQASLDEALAMQARALSDIEAMRTKTLAECDALRDAAGKEGYQAGMAKAQAEIEQWRVQSGARLSRLLEELGTARHDMQVEMESMLRPLLLDAVARVIGDMPLSAERVEACIRNALKEVVGREPVQVRLHPDDAQLLTQLETPLGETGREVVVIADSKVMAGGCVLVTAHGDIDAQLVTRLERLRNLLLGTSQS